MRIETYHQVAALYQGGKTSKASRSYGASAERDELTISRAGYDYQIAKQAVEEASNIREDKVAHLKTRVESGSYKVNPGDFASKLLEKYHSLQK